MITKTARVVSLAALVAAATVSAAHAKDRLPNAEEKTRIMAALQEKGFTTWKDIEFDDGQWEVDDAIGPDGRKHDIKLDTAFKVTRVQIDN
jgi:hypothetical protein